MGRVWERLIRSVRKILSALLSEQTLTDEGLATLMVEVEAILNPRPLTPVTFDPKDYEPLTPNHLLLQTGSATPAPGVFSKDDRYVRGRWRQIQWMADQFWRLWSREYLSTLLPRQKWTIKRSNIQLGDAVLIAGGGHSRNNWQMGRVCRVFPDSRNIVRQVEVNC